MAVITLEEGRSLDDNEVFCRDTGFIRQKVPGRTSLELDFWPHPTRDVEKFKEALRGEGYLHNYENSLLFKDGQEREVMWYAEAITLSGQNYLVNVIINIPKQKRLELQRGTLESQLAQAQKMEAVGTLAGGIVHNFNNILAAVLGFAEIAQEMSQEGGQDNSTELPQIVEVPQRASHLVRQILTFSRNIKTERRPRVLNETVAGVVGILERTLPKVISIETRLTPDLLSIDADLTQMEQVLLNLASNTKDALPQGWRFFWKRPAWRWASGSGSSGSMWNRAPYVQLTVNDNGQGMDLDIQGQVFATFFTIKEPD
ncbi:hypothetical protein DFAR_3720008 [Desulfarculales bacterium]